MSVDIAAIVAAATSVVNAIVAAAPAIEKGAVDSAPYVQAIAGLITGSNATQEQIDSLLEQVNAASADFQAPLPPDDGTTTT
jgi:ABC-type transporter Mla subunit MlaD